MTTQPDAPGAKVWTDAEIDARRPKVAGSFLWDDATGTFIPVAPPAPQPEPAPVAPVAGLADPAPETVRTTSKGAK
jgi:hypothetical protein